MLYVPEGCAHGYQTLQDHSVVFYHVFEFYHPDSSGGVRWDDPAFNIQWPPADQRTISEKDLAFPDFSA
jgi:dTDP-4-dehydrorhamnose 3,5-epimerase